MTQDVSPLATERTTCRVCGASLREVLDLGDFALSDFVRPDVPEDRVPLTLCECEQCSLVQLRHTVERDRLYRHFWYVSGINPSMVESLRDVVAGVESRIDLNPSDTVIDVGTNDGTLMTLYTKSVNKIGFDPARNLADQATRACNAFINDYFETAAIALPQAKVITSIAMFYDLDDPHAFVQRVVDVLASDGIWVVQMTDLVRMLKANAFDNICHEHLCYYSLHVLRHLVNQYGLDVFDVECNDVNGGSLRAYIGFQGARIPTEAVAQFLADEAKYASGDALERFSGRVKFARDRVCDFIHEQRIAGKRIHVLGASTKGNTLLQFFGLSDREIDCAAEVNAEKFGLKTAGSNIPIVSQDESLAAKPDFYLVLPWHFIEFFHRKLSPYLAAGGQLLTPLPTPQLYGAHDIVPL